jgi:serine protease AprX
MRKMILGRGLRAIVATLAAVTFLAATSTPAHAGLLGGLVGGLVDTTVDLLGSVTGILSPGWDDDATTPPVPMSTVADAIGADDLWRDGITGRGVGVALIDTGTVSVKGLTNGQVANGPDLSFDSQVDDLRYLDGFGHGTHMAGIIAGNDNTRGGFRGVAPGARLVNLKVGAADGGVDVSQVIAAIDWVVQHRNDNGMNIRVINLAYGTDGVQSHLLDPLSYAVEAAWRNGIVVVVGAGNDGTSHPTLVNPAVNPYVLAVGAADLHATASVNDDTVAPFSSRGSSSRSADLVAPGVSIASLRDPGSTIDREHPGAVVDERFFRGSGTSQATAVTSGAVALLLQARPKLTPDQVKAVLKRSATPLADTHVRAQGAGRIDVYRATYTSVPWSSTQSWTKGTGTGSIELARGTAHVSDEGVELTGEQDIFGTAWNGAAWAPTALAGTSWSGGIWNGNTWTGDCWCGTSWTTATWTGSKWTGSKWTGSKWTGSNWNGSKWTGSKWTHESWTGSKWTGSKWTGEVWQAG